MKKSLILPVLTLLAIAGGCGNDRSPVDVQPSLDDLVIANCYAVQQAAEDFAAGNNGVYPVNVDKDKNLDGNTLVDLLPGGLYLTNPFTNIRSEPFSGAAMVSGQTGYVAAIDSVAVGYTITGFGANFFIITLVKGP